MEMQAMARPASGEERKWWARAVVLLVAVTLSGVLAASGQARAHDHVVPETVLKKGDRGLQAGTGVIESSWVYPAGGGVCTSETAFYTFRYPDVDRVAPGSALRVRVFKAQRPDSFEIGAYPKVDEKGQPEGRGRRLGSTLKPVVRDGKTVAWDAVFTVERPDRDYYLIGSGRWKDRQGCGMEQYAYWGFHVETGAERG